MIEGLPRRQSTIIIQLRMGHIGLNYHLFRIGKANSPNCPSCGFRIETVHHFLMKCPTFEVPRRLHLYANGYSALNVGRLLSIPSLIKHAINFVEASRRFERLLPHNENTGRPT
jgi:hypothetical protein